jgi:L-lactate dehydrogenase complex protein LldG
MTDPITSTRKGIENIRRSLGRSENSTLGPSTQLRTGPRPAVYASRQPDSVDAEAGRFIEEVRKLSGVAEQFPAGAVPEALKVLVAENGIRKAAAWETPRLQQLQITNYLSALGVELISPTASKYEMAFCDVGITEADALLPETGTLALRASAEKPRAVSLLPRIHLAIVRPEMLRPDLHQVFAEQAGKTGPEGRLRPDYMVFITGPSRTADIELTVTLGVHGPKSLFVWMIP